MKERKTGYESHNYFRGQCGVFKELAPEGTLEDQNLFCLGAIANDETACALLAVSFYDDAACIEWLYTARPYRRKGAAWRLLKTLKSLLGKMKEPSTVQRKRSLS